MEQEAQTPAVSSPAVSQIRLEDAIHSADRDTLLRAASDPALTPDLALALLARADLPAEVIEQLAKHRAILKQRKVKLALASHPRAPRQVSVPLVRQFYTFDLMRVALSPLVPADVKRMADETLVARLKTTTLGERLTLARQASGQIAGELLLDTEPRTMRTALENARLTEAPVVRAVLRPEAGAALIQAVAQHRNWSARRDVQIALLRSEHLSLAKALTFAQGFSGQQLAEVLEHSRLPRAIKDQLLRTKSGEASRALDARPR